MGRRTSGEFHFYLFRERFHVTFITFVNLCQNDLIADGGDVQHVHYLPVRNFKTMTRIDQKQDPAQCRPAFEITVHQVCPDINFFLGCLGIAVAWKIDQMQASAQFKEIDLLSAARSVGRARKSVPVGQCVDQARLAHIRSASKSYLCQFKLWQHLLDCSTGDKLALLGKKKSSSLDKFCRHILTVRFRPVCHGRGRVSFFHQDELRKHPYAS